MRTRVLAAVIAASLTSFAAFAAHPLLPSGGRDPVPARLVSLPTPKGNFERAPVSFSWALDPSDALATPAPHLAESREYWQTVDGSVLAAGVALDLTAPNALIRVSPATGARPLRADAMRVSREGREVALTRMATAEQLQAVGMDMTRGTAIVRTATDTRRGRYQLQVPQAQGRYVVHVFEPQSPVVLKAQADSHRVLGGDTINVDISLDDAGRPLDARAQALLVAPDGSSLPLRVVRDRTGRLTAGARLPAHLSAGPGLWELQVFASADGVQRDARTAFAVAAPTARLSGEYAVNAAALRVALPVEAGSSGRYEARGTLYATGRDRVLRPVAQAHAAAWMEPGPGMLVLDFDRKHLPAGYGAPFEVRHVELHDQTRIAPLESRDRGVRF